MANAPHKPIFDAQRYEVLGQLGSGGMGSVYRVRDRERGGIVALKTLDRPDAVNIVRFKREFRTLADLRHENLAALYELMAEGDAWYFTMEYVDGVPFTEWVRPPHAAGGSGGVVLRTGPSRAELPTLDDLPEVPEGAGGPAARREDPARDATQSLDSWAISPTVERLPDVTVPRSTAAARPLRPDRLYPAFRQLAEGVYALHQAGTVHRDLKPSNVLVTPEGRVVILDFGLSKRQGSTTVTGHGLSGTPAYMAPEQVRETDPRPASDWYAAGVMLFEALSGQLPFDGPMLDVLLRKQAMRPPSPKSLDPSADTALSQLCLELLDPNPEARPDGPTILQRLDDLTREHRPPEVSTRQTPPPTRSPRPSVPGMTSATEGDAFIGRTAELERLTGALTQAREGQLAVALVEGGSGLGKTALVERFLRDAEGLAQGRPLVALRGRCRERETVPYKAFDAAVDDLSQVLVSLSEADLAYVLPEQVQSLATLFPVLRRVSLIDDPRYAAPVRQDAQELRDQAFLALRNLLARLGRIHTVILFVDDLQWADRDSVTLMQALLRQPGAPGILLLATLRPVRTIPYPDLTSALSDIRARADTCWIELGPLPEGEARALATALLAEHARRLGVEAPPLSALADTVVREAQGNPYFISELVHHLEHLSGDGDSLDSFSEELVRLDRLLLRRMEALPETERRLLEAAAVAGRPAPQHVLARVVGSQVGDPAFDKALLGLESARLLRCGGFRAHGLVETYHDRVREAVSENLSPDARARIHGALARALVAEEVSEPEWIATQFLAAGEDQEARAHIRAAARRAREQLAFERAARLYETAIRLERDARPDSVVLLWRDLAECLAAAGRTHDAAEAYLSAAQAAPADRRIDLRHRAAEQLLRGGHIQRGLDLLEEVLREVHLSLPSSPRRAMLSVGWRLLWLRLRGLRMTPKAPDQIPEAVQRRLDVLWSANNGLSVVDTVRSADFLMRFLQLALREGDLNRVAAGLAILSGTLAALGGRRLRRAQVLSREAGRLAHKSGDPKTAGIALMTHALVHYFGGAFRDAADELMEAEKHFLEHCHGVPWELATTRSFLCFSLRILGDLKELAERFDRYTEAAERIGDRYTVANLRTYQSIVWLLRDDPDRAARDIEHVLDPWPADSYQVQHLFHLYARCEQALYRGDPESAWAQLAAERARVARSGQLNVSGLRLEFARITGRVAVAKAATLPGEDRAPYLREARRAMRILARGEHDAGRAWGALVAAGVAWLSRPNPERGLEAPENQPARAALDRGLAAAERGGTAALAAVVRRRLGERLPGQEGDALRAQADAWLTAQGVVRPDRLVRCLLPGFEDAAPAHRALSAG